MIHKKVRLLQLAANANNKKIKTSGHYLMSKRSIISSCSDLEDFAERLHDKDPEFGGIEHHFILVRNQVLARLRGNGVIIGISVIEELLFLAITRQEENAPVDEVFRVIRQMGLHRPGFILYPLHSLGFVGIGFTGFFSGKTYRFIVKEAGIAIGPQNNSQEELLKFLRAAADALNLKRKEPEDEIAHFVRGGALKWLTRNPLMVVKCRSFSMEHYENQAMLIIKLKFAATVITMLYAMQKPVPEEVKIYSTSDLNNFSTLNIKHYIVFETLPNRGSKFRVRRVPINFSKAELSELSELNMEINPLEWARRKPLVGKLVKAIQFVEKAYMEHAIGRGVAGRSEPVAKMFSKLFLALDFFRRSFRNSAKGEDGIINLAVAFETLLTDTYSPKVAKRIKKRVAILLKGVAGSRKMIASVEQLSKARNSSVHTGVAENPPDKGVCRLAFIYAFLGLVNHLASTPIKDLRKLTIGEIIGDLEPSGELLPPCPACGAQKRVQET